MNKTDVVAALEKVGEARTKWVQASTAFNADVNAVMKRLINEAAVNHMSVEEVAKAAGLTAKRVRLLMRENNLNPKNSKRLLARTAAETLETNAALLGVEPRDFDLTSPLAYLPMGSSLREFLGNSVSGADLVDPDEDIESSEYEALADTIYDAMPWEGETYQAAAETLASAVISGGWSRIKCEVPA